MNDATKGRIERLRAALELIRTSDGFAGGTTVLELQGIARDALRDDSRNWQGEQNERS
jgi:Tfp pilus assembly protein PilW